MKDMVGEGKAGNRKLPVWPDAIAGLHARSCTLVAEAVQWKGNGVSSWKQKKKQQFEGKRQEYRKG